MGTSYCVTIIVGAGILGLPGAASQMAGANSVYVWLANLLLVIPLLFVFGKLISKSQSAGGVSDFVRLAFGSGVLFRFSQALLIVTLVVGTAAIAIVGAEYFASSLGFNGFWTGMMAVGLIFLPTLINLAGIRLSGKWQSLAAALLISFLCLVIFSSVNHWNLDHIVSYDPQKFLGMWQAMGMVWFAFTGIEMVSFLGEEFKSPRIFILSLATSILIIGFLYLGLAIAIKESVAQENPLLVKSPISAILNETLGSGYGKLGGLFGFLLIFVNLTAAILGASRLIFAVGREGVLLPKAAGVLINGVPKTALSLLGVSSCILVVVILASGIPLTSFFTIISENWFILYLLAIVSFLKLSDTSSERVLGVLSLLLSLIFMSSFSWLLIIPAAVFLGTAIKFRKRSTHVAK